MAAPQASFVTVVSGLPRSGTSLLMQMLEAGGLPVLSDAARPPDAHNPRGYYELAAVRRTRDDASWVVAARGRAVKVVYRLLPELPRSESYRVLFLRRPLAEVHASQEAMLARAGQRAEPLERAEFEQLFAAEQRRVLRWLRAQPHFATLEVDYHALLARPVAQARAIDAFLGGGLDPEAMGRAVDPALHRQRA